MPSKSSPSRRQLQARERIKRETIKRHERIRRHVEYVRRIEKAASERVLKAALKAVRGKGIYEPKSIELTKYRRGRIKKIQRQYGKLLDPKAFFFVQAPKARRAEVVERAEALKLKHTRTGVFVEREGHKKARLKEDKKNNELYIERSGRTKRGPLRGKRYTTITPLASVDELDNQRERIRALADKLPLRNSRERFAFKIKENGLEGYSHKTFSDIDLLLDDLDHYQKEVAARINFYRHIELERVENSLEWFKEHPARSRAERRAILRRSRTFKARPR